MARMSPEAIDEVLGKLSPAQERLLIAVHRHERRRHRDRRPTREALLRLGLVEHWDSGAWVLTDQGEQVAAILASRQEK